MNITVSLLNSTSNSTNSTHRSNGNTNVDLETTKFLASLYINILIGSIIYILFELFRNQSEIYIPKFRHYNHSNMPYPKPPRGLFQWFKPVYNISDEDLIPHIGMDAYVLLRYLKMLTKVSVEIGIFAITVLTPTYFFADNNDVTLGINKYSMANIPPGNVQLWGSLLVFYLYTMYLLHLLYKEYENFIVRRRKYFEEGDASIEMQLAYSVMVEEIPESCRSSEAIFKLFDQLFPGDVQVACICVNVEPLEDALSSREHALYMLEKNIAKYLGGKLDENGNRIRPTRKLSTGMCSSVKVDCIEYWQEKLEKWNDEVKRLQQQAVEMENTPAEDHYHGFLENFASSSKNIIASSGKNILSSLSSLNLHEDNSASKKERAEKCSKTTIKGKDLKKTEEIKSSDIDMNVDSKNKLSDDELGSSDKASHSSKKRKSLMHMFSNDNITKKDITSTGFITFRSRRNQATACQVPVLSEEYEAIIVSPAPQPNDIIWRNIGSTSDFVYRSKTITTFFYTLGVLFWGVILAFVASISKLENVAKIIPVVNDIPQSLKAIIAGQLPVYMLQYFQDLVPYYMTVISTNFERRKLKSDIQFRVFKWYFIYQMASVFLTLVAQSIISTVASIIASPFSLFGFLGTAIPTVSVFFMNFAISEALVTNVFTLLRPWEIGIYYIYINIFDKNLLTRRMLIDGPLAEEAYDYGADLPKILFIYLLMVLYWVIAPFIVFVAAAYFALKYISSKYMFMYVYEREFEGGGEFFYGLFDYTFIGLKASTLVMIAYMSIKQGAQQVPLLIPLYFIINNIKASIERKFHRLSKNFPYSSAVKVDMASTEEKYIEQIDCFDPNYLRNPSISEPKAHPYPYRINNIPLLNADDELELPYKQEESGLPHCLITEDMADTIYEEPEYKQEFDMNEKFDDKNIELVKIKEQSRSNVDDFVEKKKKRTNFPLATSYKRPVINEIDIELSRQQELALLKNKDYKALFDRNAEYEI